MNHWDRRFMELAKIIAGWSKDAIYYCIITESRQDCDPDATPHHNLNLYKRLKS